MAYVIRPSDRLWFKRCRRSWDFGSRERQNYEPVAPPVNLDVDRALRDALAVYYFPGMWEWDRSIVLPLTFAAFDKAMHTQRERQDSPPGEADAAFEEGLSSGRKLLEHYLAWAPAADRFWPVRVESDFDVAVPDPANPGGDLVSPDGQPVRYQGRLDMLVVDEHDAYWVVRHRLVAGTFTDLDLLALDEEPLAACWAWELFYLGMRVAGTIHNELRREGDPPDPAEPVRRPRASRAWARARAAAREERLAAEAPQAPPAPVAGHRRMYVRTNWEPKDVVVEEGGGMFRRTRIPRSRAELGALGDRLALETFDMGDPALALYPASAVDHCSRCDFRAPCLAMNEGGDVEAVLAAGYRIRPPEAPEEGRFGGATWSMNRGAAPPPNWSRTRPR